MERVLGADAAFVVEPLRGEGGRQRRARAGPPRGIHGQEHPCPGPPPCRDGEASRARARRRRAIILVSCLRPAFRGARGASPPPPGRQGRRWLERPHDLRARPRRGAAGRVPRTSGARPTWRRRSAPRRSPGASSSTCPAACRAARGAAGRGPGPDSRRTARSSCRRGSTSTRRPSTQGWIRRAEELQRAMDAHFWDDAKGGYFNSAAGAAGRPRAAQGGLRRRGARGELDRGDEPLPPRRRSRATRPARAGQADHRRLPREVGGGARMRCRSCCARSSPRSSRPATSS